MAKAQNQCIEKSTLSRVKDQTIRLEMAIQGQAHFTISVHRVLASLTAICTQWVQEVELQASGHSASHSRSIGRVTTCSQQLYMTICAGVCEQWLNPLL